MSEESQITEELPEPESPNELERPGGPAETVQAQEPRQSGFLQAMLGRLGITLPGGGGIEGSAIAVLLLVAILAGSALLGVGPFHHPDSTNTPTQPNSSAVTPTSTSTTPPSASVAPVVEISSPTDGLPVIGHEGILLQGTAANLGDKFLHIVDYADNGQYYLVGHLPIQIDGGRWSVRHEGVGAAGSTGDVGHTFVLIAVLADRECEKAFTSAVPNASGDIRFPVLPTGCTKAAEVRVIKKAP